MQFNNFQEAIQAVLEEPIVNAPDNTINKDLFSDTNLLALETYTDFLDLLPKDAYYQIAKELLDIIMDFQNGHTYENKKRVEEQRINYLRATGGEETKIDRRTPSIKLNSSTKTLEEAKELICKYFNLGLPDYDAHPMLTMNHPQGFKETLHFLTNLIDDLKNKRFEMLEKINFYNFDTRSKTPLKNYINEIIKKYSLKSTTVPKKEFIDSIK